MADPFFCAVALQAVALQAVALHPVELHNNNVNVQRLALKDEMEMAWRLSK